MTEALEKELGYRFSDQQLLITALTHPTFVNEHPDAAPHYERLEFLGDAVVGLLAAEALFATHPDKREGELSRMRAQLVCRPELALRADELQLGRHVRVGQSLADAETGPGETVLSNAFEALVGALMLDGGLDEVRKVIGPRLLSTVGARQISSLRDAKTELQEAAHRQSWAPPTYVLSETRGPAHNRQYVVEVTCGPLVRLRGIGTSKKRAEQVCAGRALEAMSRAIAPSESNDNG